MRTIEAYHCDYCKKYSKSKRAITRHEKECYHNPITKACATCVNFGQTDHKRFDELFGEVTSIRPVCDKGINISPDNSNYEMGYQVKLRNHCPKWEQRIEEDDV